MRSRSFTHLCFVTVLVSQVHGQTQTTALWLFDEPVGCYPSTTLTDDGKNLKIIHPSRILTLLGSPGPR